jgi:hypothetical protein
MYLSIGDLFFRNWTEYRDGFAAAGNEDSRYWLGNANLAALTAQRNCTMTLVARRWWPLPELKQRAEYTEFRVLDESQNFAVDYNTYFPIIWAPYLPPAENVFEPPSHPDKQIKGAEFRTYDRDLNGCAATHKSGWWFDTGCALGDPNGEFPRDWPVNGAYETIHDSYMFCQGIGALNVP